MTNVAAFTEMLHGLLLAEGLGEAAFEVDGFRDTGPLTRNDGLVVQFRNGDAFQLTIAQSASAPESEPADAATCDVAVPRGDDGGRSSPPRSPWSRRPRKRSSGSPGRHGARASSSTGMPGTAGTTRVP